MFCVMVVGRETGRRVPAPIRYNGRGIPTVSDLRVPLAAHVPVAHLAGDSRTLGEMFWRRCRASAERPAIFERDGATGRWVPLRWSEFYDHAARVARGLVDLGLAPGDPVAILGPTRAPWSYYDLGAHLAGLVTLGIYQLQTVAQQRYLLEHSEARVVFVEGEVELERVLEAARGLPRLVAIVPWEDALAERFAGRDARIVPPGRFRAPTPPVGDDERDRRLAARTPDDTALLIYTSGTTGPPKGAMISHGNILSLLEAQGRLIDLYEDDLTFSFLPMAHAAERVLSCYGRVDSGMPIAYATSVAAVLTEILEVRPTFFGSVPRIFEKAYARIHAEVARARPPVRRLFAWATSVGRRRARLLLEGRPVPLGLALRHRLADRLVLSRLRRVFGGRVRQFAVGAAPVALEILEFFWGAGLPVFEVYGLTEATVLTHANRPGSVRLGTVGRPVPPLEARIAEDGEVLLRAPWVFRGYFKDPAATAEAMKDGWLHTGDVGGIDEDGYLKITDRKKHLIITAGGKNLAPANIENAIKTSDPIVSQVHAHGDRRPYVSALVAPSPVETLEWGADRGLLPRAEVEERTRELLANPAARSPSLERAMALVVGHPEFQARVRDAVRRGNERLAHAEQVRRFRILDRDFSQEHGELTPTMKLKRREMERKYADLFERIYTDESFGIET